MIRYAQFFFNYLFLFLDKSVYCLNFTLQWSPVSKSTILERNVWVLFFSFYYCCSQWSVIGMPSFWLWMFSVSQCLNFTLQWSPVSKSTILERNVWVLFSGDYGCCSQWSVIRYAQFFFNYLFLFLDKSVYCLNFTLQWSPVSKSTILERNVWVLFLANWWLWMLLSVVSDQVCPVFMYAFQWSVNHFTLQWVCPVFL